MKNRNRNQYSFANINLLGKCNLNCYFCLGRDLEEEFSRYDYNRVFFDGWPNLQKYLNICRKEKIQQLYISGQNTDPLCYSYIEELIQFLKEEGFFVGIRTNGVGVSPITMDTIINQCNTCKGDAVGYTILSLDPKIQKKITNGTLPEWEYILKATKVPYRISIVVTPENENEILSIIQYVAKFTENKNCPKYIQIRKVSTDHRAVVLHSCQEAYDRIKQRLCYASNKKLEEYETASIVEIDKLPVVFWETVNTTANSMNYFVNGVISTNYFIIEGYEQEKRFEIQ